MFEASCKTKVGNLGATVSTEQNVGQFEVTVNDTMRVNVFKTIELYDNDSKARYHSTILRVYTYQFCCVETRNIDGETTTLTDEPRVQVPAIV